LEASLTEIQPWVALGNEVFLFVQVEKHLAEYQKIIVASPHAERLALTLERATQWLPTAQAVLKHPVSDHMAAEYKVCLSPRDI
jgi:hypothetical protein